MKTLFLLIMLTQNGAGDINVAFVNTETLAQCQQKLLMLEGVFQASEIPVIERRCMESELQFSTFGHAANSSKIINFYQIYFNEARVRVLPVSDWKTCNNLHKPEAEQARVYCSSSVQSLRKN